MAMTTEEIPQKVKVEVKIEYPEDRFAEIACKSIAVDKELRAGVISRNYSFSGRFLTAFVSTLFFKKNLTLTTELSNLMMLNLFAHQFQHSLICLVLPMLQ